MPKKRAWKYKELFWLLAILFLGLSQHSWFSWSYVAGKIQSHTHNSTTGGGNLSTPNVTSFLNITASTSVAVSASDRARLMYDSVDNTLKVSEDGAAFRPMRGWAVIGSSVTASGVSSLSVGGLSLGDSYRLEVDIAKVTNGRLWLRFNSDAGSDYYWAIFGTNQGGTNGSVGGVADTKIEIVYNSENCRNGAPYVGSFMFSHRQSSGDNDVALTGTASCFSTVSSFSTYLIGGLWDATGDISSIQLVAQTGTFTGSMTVLRLDR